jgi:hypothetical protein
MDLGISLVLESDVGANFSGLIYRELRDRTSPNHLGFSAAFHKDNENAALAKFFQTAC